MPKPIAFGGWDVIRSSESTFSDLHVVPRFDLVPHIVSVKCGCGPKVEETALRRVVIHHAADNREHYEHLGLM